MPLLTPYEHDLCTGKITGDPQAKHAATNKLRAFQAQITDAEHIAKINDLIPLAEAEAHKAMEFNQHYNKAIHSWDRVFHRAMNRMKREAGLIN